MSNTYTQYISFSGPGSVQPDGRGGQISTPQALGSRFAFIKPYRGKPDESGERIGSQRLYLIECWHDPAYLPKAGHTIDWDGITLSITECTYLDATKTKLKLVAAEQA